MKINPCPNPKCRTAYDPEVVAYLDDDDDDDEVTTVYCPSCKTKGPACHGREQAIAAWNSISMGWITVDRAPKDGTEILGLLLSHDGHPYAALTNWAEQGLYHPAGWSNPYCTYDGEEVEFLPMERLIGWMPIPPTPEGK